MKALALLVLLVAGVAAAQPGPTNCRSAAFNCNAADFYGNHLFARTPVGASGVLIGGLTSAGQVFAGIGFDNNGASLLFMASNGSEQCRVSGGTGDLDCTAQARNVRAASGIFSQVSGSNAVSVTVTGAWIDFGAGANDRMKSDGTNLMADTSIVPNNGANSSLGVSAAGWGKSYFDYGPVINRGNGTKFTNPPISDNTTEESQLLFNNTTQEPAYGSSSRKYNPIGQAREWAVEKRTQVADIGFENTNCPLAAPGLKGSGAAGVTYACTDAAAAGQNTLSGESYRVLNTTAAASSISIVNTSANMTKRELGPKYLQRVSVPAGSSTAVRFWVALVPQATSLTGVDTGAISVAGFRFSTVAGDTAWQACTGDGATTTCTTTSIALATGTNITLEVDCRESSACDFFIDGSLVVRKTTNLPATTTQLAPRASVEATSAAARALWYGRSSVQTN